MAQPNLVDALQLRDFVTIFGCDKPVSDYYPVSNLITDRFRQPNGFSGTTGFVADSFVKPPVNVRFEFNCAVRKLVAVSIGLQVGSQRSTSVEVHVGPGNNSGSLWRIGRFYSTDSDSHKNHVIFKNDVDTLPNWLNLNADLTLNMGAPPISQLIKIVIVRITRSVGCPCLSYVKLWIEVSSSSVLLDNQPIPSAAINGHPATATEQFTEQSVNELRSLRRPAGSKNQTEDGPGQQSPESKIPEEFIDPLTCEIMNLPVLLPCGRTIDRSTLERWIQELANCGKVPMDPYTGLHFTSVLAPKPNKSLKLQMDRFWIRHPCLASSEDIGHTVGGADFNVTSTTLPVREKLRRHYASKHAKSIVSPNLNVLPVSDVGSSQLSSRHVKDDASNLEKSVSLVLQNMPSFL